MSRQPNAGRSPRFLGWLKSLSVLVQLPTCDCEDCVQDACLSLSESHPDWSLDEPKTQAWLAYVVRNKALDFHRRSRRNRVRSLDDLSHVPCAKNAETSSDGDDADRNAEKNADVELLLSQLSGENREIFVERVQHDHTFRAIGESLKLPHDQVKARYFRTLKKLRELAAKLARDRDCNDRGGGLIAWWR